MNLTDVMNGVDGVGNYTGGDDDYVDYPRENTTTGLLYPNESAGPTPISATGPKDVPLFSYIVEGVLLLTISLVGCFGNVFSVLGLARNKKTRSFTKLLIALAVCDFLYLVMGIMIFGIPTVSPWYKTSVYIYILPVW